MPKHCSRGSDRWQALVEAVPTGTGIKVSDGNISVIAAKHQNVVKPLIEAMLRSTGQAYM